MEYLFILLATFIGMLFLMQLVFFEITRSKMAKAENVNWYLSLDKSFSYNRVGYMLFICFICYLVSSPEDMFTASWFIYFILFLAMGVVADAIVQYLILVYSKKRCRKEIEDAKLLKNELLQIAQTISGEAEEPEQSTPQYDDEAILKQYLLPEDHLAFLSVDNGEFAKNFTPQPEATFLIEPYADEKVLEQKFADTSMKITTLTPAGQLPFKDEKIDVFMCRYSNYDKAEVQRVLKPNGYFIVQQNGTANLKEFVSLYMPFRMKGSWDAYSCAGTLEGIGMRIINKFEDYGTLRFHSIESLHQFFKRESPDLANINKYQVFYLKALKAIKDHHYFEMTTHKFLVIAQKVS